MCFLQRETPKYNNKEDFGALRFKAHVYTTTAPQMGAKLVCGPKASDQKNCHRVLLWTLRTQFWKHC